MTFDAVLCVRIFLVATSLVLGLLSVLTFHRRKESPQGIAFSLLTMAGALYSFGYAGEVAQTTVLAAQHWLQFEYLGLPWIPGIWLWAACRHNRVKAPVPALFAIPALAFVAMYTNPWHGLLYGPFTLVQHGPFWVLSMHRGPIAMLDNTYLLSSFFIGVWVYGQAYRDSTAFFRRQALLILISSFVPIACYFIYLAGLSPWGLDISPIALAFSALLYYIALTRLGLVDVAPMTRRLIFTSMRDAVIVVDEQDRLLDFNPAAQRLLPHLSTSGMRQPVAAVFAAYPGLSESLLRREDCEIHVGDEDNQKQFEMRSFPLLGHGRKLGHATILADITAQGRLRDELRQHAETDTLTGIANRRRFHQALEVECGRFNRYRAPFSLLLIDIDRFKLINDRFGHPAGDAVLCAMAVRLNGCLRESDVLARYGGEEFGILLVATNREEASVIAERIRLAVEQEPLLGDRGMLPVTVSIGVITQSDGEYADQAVLVKQADLALYKAKAQGRNRVVAALPEIANWLDDGRDLRPM